MAFRFIHTADWQLGKSLASIPDDAGADVRRARLEAVKRIASLASERGAQAVLVAGDAFDSHLPTGRTLAQAIDAMRGFAGPWVLLPGNHDAAEMSDLWDRLAAQATGLHLVVAREPAVIHLDAVSADILPAPLRRRHAADDPTAWMAEAPSAAGVIRVGLAHGSVQGFESEDAGTPNLIDPRRAEQAKLDYLALGDWHGTLEIGRRCWYSGTPEPDRFRRNDPGNVLLVEIDEAGALPRVERVRTAGFDWLELQLDHVGETSVLIRDIDAALEGRPALDRVLLSLRLAGEIDLAGRALLGERLDHWRARLCHLRLDDERLTDRPSDEDLATLAGTGIVAAAASRLAQLAQEASGEEAQIARLALRRLFLLQHRVAGRG